MREIQIQLFGAFRDLAPSGVCTLSVSGKESPAEIKSLVSGKLSAAGFDVATLLSKSVVASDSAILSDSSAIGDARKLALLPPVCGG